jgi:hypothetical protein
MPSCSVNDWDGICACGKVAMDGKKCALGATHALSPARSPCQALDFVRPETKLVPDAIKSVETQEGR